MAQHDYSIANQGFPATRSDINNVLSAIATNNSGTSAPSTQYAGQFWIDTTSSTWTLYIHDGADDIQFATIDTSANTVNFIDSELGDNSVTTSKIADANVTSAKLSYPLTTFSSTGIDDNATSTAITIDSSENVLIGTTDVGYPVFGDNLTLEGSTHSGITIRSGTTSQGNLYFSDATGTGAGTYAGAINYLHSVDAMVFRSDSTERMRLDSSGNLMVGTTDSTPASSSSGSGISLRENGSIEASRDGSAPLFLNRSSSDGKIIDLYKDGTAVGSISVQAGDNILLEATATDHAGINLVANAIVPRQNGSGSDNGLDLGGSGNRFKDLYLGGGLYVGGTGTANKLDDYEEGTWTPTLTYSGGQTATLTNESGSYTKIGRNVTINFSLSVSNTNSGSGNVFVESLPFAPSNILSPTGLEAGGVIGYWNNWGSAISSAFLLVDQSNKLLLYGTVGTSTASANQIGAGTLSTGEFRGSITYFTDA